MSRPPEPAPAKVLVAALVVGGAVMAYGVRAARRDRADAHPDALLVHLVAFDLLHDVVVAPLAVAVAWLVGRVVPPVARGPVRAALAGSAIVVVFSFPLVRGWGRRPTNSSTLPLDYGRNLAIVLAAIWAVAAAVVAARWLRRGRDARRPEAPS